MTSNNYDVFGILQNTCVHKGLTHYFFSNQNKGIQQLKFNKSKYQSNFFHSQWQNHRYPLDSCTSFDNLFRKCYMDMAANTLAQNIQVCTLKKRGFIVVSMCTYIAD